MRIEELSVGDWIATESAQLEIKGDDIATAFVDKVKKPIQIVSVLGAEQLVFGRIEGLDGFTTIYLKAEHIEPIPLTPEILEKNGFGRKKYTIDTAEAQEIEYDGYRYILCQDRVQYDIILVDSLGGYFDLEIESSHRDEAGERILISSRLSLDYVEFVHQLQHALRLAGVEKEIEV